MYAELKQKICKDCNESKDLVDYRRVSRGKETTQPYCRDCRNIKEHKRGLIRNYGINVEQYNKLFTSQEGKCAICGRHQTEFKRRLAVDHPHGTKEIRELLCIHCNQGIGHFMDNT